jgi:uncharacterized protein (DUF1501 family)
VKRREFLKNSALALGALPLVPEMLRAGPAEKLSSPVLLVVFLRGGEDGLNVVVPFGDADYSGLRPDIRIPPPGEAFGALDLDGHFGLHPRLSGLTDLYRSGSLAVIHACGSHNPSRSHFDAMDIMESGSSSEKLPDGWLNRYLQTSRIGYGVFRAVAVGPSLPRSLSGSAHAMALADLAALRVGDSPQMRTYLQAIEDMYSARSDALGGAARSALEALSLGENTLDPESYTPEHGAEYGAGDFAQSLRAVAQMIKAGVGLEVAEVDLGGWDTHTNQGSGENGALASVLETLDQGLGAFVTDLGGRMGYVVILVMTEFGRAAAQNGSGGTDHGHGTALFILGGRVLGGKVYGDWPGLKTNQLYQQRDLAVTTDFRRVFGEVLESHMGCSQIGLVFPDYAYEAEKPLHLFG